MNDKVIPIQAAGGKPSGAFEFISTKKDELIGWARKFSLFPYPFVTACCAMEFMAVSSTPYDTDRFGAALGQAGLKRTTGLAMPALIIGANLPDVDAACFFWLEGTEHLAFRRGITHGGVRCSTTTSAASGAIAGMTWMAEAPVPTTATRLPRRSTARSQRAVCMAGPVKSALPGISG